MHQVSVKKPGKRRAEQSQLPAMHKRGFVRANAQMRAVLGWKGFEMANKKATLDKTALLAMEVVMPPSPSKPGSGTTSHPPALTHRGAAHRGALHASRAVLRAGVCSAVSAGAGRRAWTLGGRASPSCCCREESWR